MHDLATALDLLLGGNDSLLIVLRVRVVLLDLVDHLLPLLLDHLSLGFRCVLRLQLLELGVQLAIKALILLNLNLAVLIVLVVLAELLG